MQCHASLTDEVCLESENLLRSYHLNPPPLIAGYSVSRNLVQLN